MRFETESSHFHDARMWVLAVLQEYQLSMDQAVKVLAQCHRHIQNRMAIEGMASESRLKLDGFRTGEDMDLYYDIAKDGYDIGFISKGWDEPGFRIGELLILPAEAVDAFRRRAPEIMDFCSTNGIVCTGKLTPEGLELSLIDNIYSDGFNIITFVQTLEAVQACAERVRQLLGHN